MKYYANAKDDLFALEDDADDSFIPPNTRPISESEYRELLAAKEAQVTQGELVSRALSKRDSLLSLAAIRIAPLQDAVDEDMATAADLALLKKWKQYRIAVNRIQDQSGFPSSIEWPIEPI